MQASQHYITPEQLRVGLYIHLDLSWMEHPLPFSSFKIKDEAQLESVRRLGLPRIRYEPEKCDGEPAPTVQAAAQAVPPPMPAQPGTDAASVDASVIEEKKRHAEQLKRIRRELGAVEKKFRLAAESVQTIRRNIDTQPREALQEADRLVGQMVDAILAEGDVMIHAMSDRLGDDVYFHSLNVAVLSLMLARVLKLEAPDMRELGVGALFHDFGKLEVPHSITAKIEPLTRAEQTFLELHCEYGLGIGKRAGLAQRAADIVYQHHEYVDGTGYPEGLKGEQITPLARLICIVNTYDNLCNPVNPALALTPPEALAHMFALKRTRFDEVQLQAFIRCLGVYPPGSVVQLSNGMYGLVIAADPSRPLKPNVLVYDPAVPREEAVILNLGREADLRISRSLRVAHLSREAYRYLRPRRRITYFFDQLPTQPESP